MLTLGIDASRANQIHRTGTEWYAWHLLQEWRVSPPQGVDIELYLRSALQSDMGALPPCMRPLFLHWPPKKMWTQVRLSMRMLRSQPDVLFVPAHTIPYFVPRRTVTTIHDVGFDRFPELYTAKELEYHRWSVRRALAAGAQIITISHFSKAELQYFYEVADDRITVIHLGFSPERFPAIDEEKIAAIKQRYALDSPYIFTIGRLEFKKNTDGLLRAYQLLREKEATRVQLVLAGKWGDGAKDIQRQLATHPFRDDVILTGPIDGMTHNALLRGAAVMSFFSRYEGFGLPPIEAMAVGVPVAASSAASIPEICGDAALYASPDDPEAHATDLHQLLIEPKIADDLRQRGHRMASRYNWGVCAAATMRVLLQSND